MYRREYLISREVSDVIKYEYEQRGKTLAVSSVIRRLYAQGHIHTGIPVMPDFASWDLQDLQELRRLTGQIPIYPYLVDQPQYLPGKKEAVYTIQAPVFIAREAFYSPAFFKRFSDQFLILYALFGTPRLHLAGEVRQLEPGALVILAPDTLWHMECSERDLVIHMMIQKQWFERYLFDIIPKDPRLFAFFNQALYARQQGSLAFCLPPKERVLSIIRGLFSEFLSMDQYSAEAYMHYIQILLAHVLRDSETAREGIEKNTALSANAIFPVIFQYMMANYETLTLEKLAGHFHYHTVYLSKLIQENTGENFTTIMTRLRIQKSKELLSTTDYPVTRVSEMSGYSKPDYFAFVFKKETGMSPSCYRKANRGSR